MTRRRLLALGAALFVARPAPAGAAPVDDDGDVLIRLIAREEEAAAAHTGVRAEHERDHARALRALLDALGRHAPPRPAATDDQPESELERALIADYEAALLELHDPSILRTAGTILASHSQHRVRARLEAGLDPFTRDP
ncbi:MAG: hypothetical protein ACXW08_15700 [Solirubrobacteraceae bacterium]